MPRQVRCGLIQARNAKGPDAGLPAIKKAMLDKHVKLIEQAARRPLDMGVRLGGEEFALLLFDIGVEEAKRRAEALRLALVELNIAHQGSDSASMLSMSIGVACLSPSVGGELNQLYEHADRALYEAKAFGRNQVVA